MKKRTIFYISKLKWFGKIKSPSYKSKKDVVYHHLIYAEKKAEIVEGEKSRFLKRIDLTDKRINSRVAFSFVFAIPNDLTNEEVKIWIKDLKKIISDVFNMKKEDLFIAYHNDIGVSGEPNKHLHIIGLNLNKEDKALKINKKELKELNKRLKEYILSNGYEIKKDKEEFKIGHIGTRLRWDKNLAKWYRELLSLKKKIEEIENKLKAKSIEEIERIKEEVKGMIKEIESGKREFTLEGLNLTEGIKEELEKITTIEEMKNLKKFIEKMSKGKTKTSRQKGKQQKPKL